MQMFPQNLATFGKKPEDASAVNIDPITRKKALFVSKSRILHIGSGLLRVQRVKRTDSMTRVFESFP